MLFVIHFSQISKVYLHFKSGKIDQILINDSHNEHTNLEKKNDSGMSKVFENILLLCVKNIISVSAYQLA